MACRIHPVRRLALLVCLGGLALGPGAALAQSEGAASSAAPDSHFTVSGDGLWVLDQRAKLAWPRCVEGMVWNGATCIGQPRRLTHGEAMDLALQRWKAEGVRWRVPRANELRRLVDKQQLRGGVNPQWFPGAPREWHWSSSTNIRAGTVNPYNYGNVMEGRTEQSTTQVGFLHGWAVNMVDGEARGDVTKSSRLPVRLVRPMPESLQD